MKNVICAHAYIIRRKGRLLVRLTCAGRVLWRSYPLDMPEDEAVMLAVKRLFPIVQPEPHRQNQQEGDVGGNDGSGDIGVSHGSPQYQPCEESQEDQVYHEINVHSLPPLRVARWGRLP